MQFESFIPTNREGFEFRLLPYQIHANILNVIDVLSIVNIQLSEFGKTILAEYFDHENKK